VNRIWSSWRPGVSLYPPTVTVHLVISYSSYTHAAVSPFRMQHYAINKFLCHLPLAIVTVKYLKNQRETDILTFFLPGTTYSECYDRRETPPRERKREVDVIEMTAKEKSSDGVAFFGPNKHPKIRESQKRRSDHKNDQTDQTDPTDQTDRSENAI
jgi:hypothetical protein